MAFLFKGGEQLYNEALDLIGRKDYSGARKKFCDADQKGYNNNGLGKVYIAIIDVGSDRSNVSYYDALRSSLDAIQTGSFKFGLTDLEVEDLKTEVELDIKEIQASRISDTDYNNKGQALIACAGEFMARIGDKNLKLDEIFKGNTVATGNREALILQAEGYSVMGKGCVAADPKTAADYMQMAYNFRKQLGDSGEEELALSKNYARSAKCWICGRPANAEGIHFQAMRSTVEPVFMSMTDGDAVKPVAPTGQAIYVCMPCFSAISNRSDDIAKYYYNQAMDEMRAMEARISAELASLRFSASMRR